jgi:hypothetical protein
VSLAALIVAIAGVVLSSLALGWQIASWLLTAGRVRLTLKHGALTGAMSYLKDVRRGPARAADLSLDPGAAATEVLAVVVRNVGRLPVTVERYGAELWGAAGSGSLIRRASPTRLLALQPIGDAIGPGLPHRLEPGTSETWLIRMDDVRAAVYATKGSNLGDARSCGMFVELGNGRTVRTRHNIGAPHGDA